MARLFFLLCAVGIIWLLLRRLTMPRRTTQRNEPPQFTQTVRCVRCGAYIDRRLARTQGDDYCCKEHEDSDL